MKNQLANVRIRTVDVRSAVRMGVPVVFVPMRVGVMVPVLVMVVVVLVVWMAVLVVFSTGGFTLDDDGTEFPCLGTYGSVRLRR